MRMTWNLGLRQVWTAAGLLRPKSAVVVQIVILAVCIGGCDGGKPSSGLDAQAGEEGDGIADSGGADQADADAKTDIAVGGDTMKADVAGGLDVQDNPDLPYEYAESPPFVPPFGWSSDDRYWLVRYADGWYSDPTSDGPLSVWKAYIPSWLYVQLDTKQPANLQQIVTVGAERYRDGVAELQAIPGRFILAIENDTPVDIPQFKQEVPRIWTFTMPNPATDSKVNELTMLGRLNFVIGGSAVGDGHFELNGRRFGVPLSVAAKIGRLTVVTGAVKAGVNTLELKCDGNADSCSVSLLAMLGGQGLQVVGSVPQNIASGQARSWLDYGGAVSRPHAIWAIITLADSTLQTTVQMGGNSVPHTVQSGVQILPSPPGASAGASIWKVLIEHNAVGSGPNAMTFTANTNCGAAGCPANGNVLSAALIVEFSEDDRICKPTPELQDSLDNDCDGLTDEADSSSP